MKKSITIFTVLLLMTMVFLAACSDDKASDTSSGKKENVKFTTYIDFDWYALDTWGNDDVSKEITERTGVSLEVTKSSDLQQLQVLLAADELPDLIFTSNQVERFFDPDLVWPWDELIDKYAPGFWDLVDPVEIANNTADDGHIYTFKTHYNNDQAWADPRNLPSPGDPGFYVREDIMEELGNPPLESLEDLLKIFEMVQTNYPDMVVYLPHPTWASPIAEYMGLSASKPDVDEDGNVRPGYLHPEFIEYFKYMNELFLAGYLSSESFAYKPEQFLQILRNGEVFAASYNSALADENNKLYDEAGIQAHFVPVTKALTYKGEDKFYPVDAGIGWASLFISKKVKDPAAAIRYMEFLKSPEGDQLTQWGIPGKHYSLNEDGLLVRPDGHAEKEVTETGIGPWYFQASGLGEGVAVSSGVLNSEYHAGVELLKFRKTRTERNPALYFTNPLADTDEFNIKVKLDDHFKNSQIGIITSASEEELVEKYNKFIEDAKKIGSENLEKYMTESYNKAKARYEN